MCGAGAKARTSLALVFRAKEVVCVVGLPSFTFLGSVLVGCSCEAHTYIFRGKAISVGPGPLMAMQQGQEHKCGFSMPKNIRPLPSIEFFSYMSVRVALLIKLC